ncbi:crossover junction endodeoxyribonuclease RuvC [Saprospiraceae bacterium]|nr:crossover junction endodeoxyribonuclease RuvC [Saprospiraceae bacterium]
MKNKILGIDPGTNILGYGILNFEGKHLKVEAMGVLHLEKYPDHTTKLKEIFLQLQDIIETYLPATLSVEAPFFGKNVQSMLKLGRAQGVAMAAGMTMGLDIYDYSPKSIKKSVTGNGNASKEQVASMLGHILKVNFVDEYLDATDALAAAMTHYNNNGIGADFPDTKKKSSTKSKFPKAKKATSWETFVKNNQGRVK